MTALTKTREQNPNHRNNPLAGGASGFSGFRSMYQKAGTSGNFQKTPRMFVFVCFIAVFKGLFSQMCIKFCSVALVFSDGGSLLKNLLKTKVRED